MFNYVNALATRLVLGALLVLGGAAAGADDSRFYLGSGLLIGEFSGSPCHIQDVVPNNPPNSFNEGSTECEPEVGFQLFGGFQFNRYTALETGYMEMKIWSATYNYSAIPSQRVNYQPEISTLYAAGIGRIPFGDEFALTGRLGVHRWSGCEPNLIFTDNRNNNDEYACRTESGTGMLLGFGAEYDFYENLRGRFNWTRIDDIGNGSVDALSASLIVTL